MRAHRRAIQPLRGAGGQYDLPIGEDARGEAAVTAEPKVVLGPKT